MERFRRNKGPLLLPVLCLAAALLIYLVVNSLWGAASVLLRTIQVPLQKSWQNET